MADAVGVVLVLAAVAVLLRRRRRPAALLGTGLVAAGWSSNLLDRLGAHEWTAPGSVRGVVDFVPSGATSRSNVADGWIVLGAVLLLWAVATRGRGRSGHGRSGHGRSASPAPALSASDAAQVSR